jgi:hypothetical protein
MALLLLIWPCDKFLKIVNVRDHDYWNMVLSSAKISQQVSVVLRFYVRIIWIRLIMIRMTFIEMHL